MGRITIAIDPGEDTGWSKWDDGSLVGAGLCQPFEYPELPFVIGLPEEPPDLIIENPEDYGSSRITDPNKLITLGRKVGELGGIYRAYYHLKGRQFVYVTVWPKKWKGQVPKEIHHDRHLPKLRQEEKSVLSAAFAQITNSKRHNVKDAICLGLWRLKR